MKKILESIDRRIRKYIGLKQDITAPDVIKKIGKKLVLIKTESYKRHCHTQKIDHFLDEHVRKLNEPAKQKLGVSLGKAIANNLLVTFEQVTIKKDEK